MSIIKKIKDNKELIIKGVIAIAVPFGLTGLVLYEIYKREKK